MDRKRRLALIFATIGIALGAGQIVQNGAHTPAQRADAAPKPTQITQVSAGPEKAPTAMKPTVAKPTVVQTATVMPMPAPVPIATAKPAEKPIVMAALTDPVVPPAPKPAATLPAPVADACPVTLDLQAQPNAMIGVTLLAPCAPQTRVVLHHAGLTITGKTSVTGALFASLPALESQAAVTATLIGTPTVTGSVTIPDLAALRRFGVQWQGDDAFQVHALENGSDYGGPGHISATNLHQPKVAQSPAGGYLTLLGDAAVTTPMLAQVYTFPATGAPDVVVEAAVTKATCGRDLLGETLTSAGGKVVVTDLTLATPDCTAIGDILVLKNLVPDLTMVAAN
jgi:hypothetical protein